MQKPLIFDVFPRLAQTVPWRPLGDFPTPVQRLHALGEALGVGNLWVKREDLSARLYGGNKVRGLEFILAEAAQRDVASILVYSTVGSSWVLACTAYAKLMGLDADVVYLNAPVDDVKRQNLAVTCELARRVARTTWRVSFPFALLRSLALARKTGKVFLAPPGGSSPPAILGHINAVFELREQCNRNELPIPDYILCPFGSGGTAAGLSIGLTLAGWPTRLVAVRVVDRVVGNRFTLRFHIRRTLRFLRSHGAELPRHVKWAQNVEVVHHCFGCGYGEPSPDGERCRELAERHEGLKLDCTYTAKTLAALLNQKESGILAETTVLFWHTLDCRELPRLPERLRTQMKTRAIA